MAASRYNSYLEALETLRVKHYTFMLYGDGKVLYLLLHHWRYLEPFKQAMRVKFAKHSLKGLYYVTDVSEFINKLRN